MQVGLKVEVGVAVTKEEVAVGKDTPATQTELKDKNDNYSNLDVLPCLLTILLILLTHIYDCFNTIMDIAIIMHCCYGLRLIQCHDSFTNYMIGHEIGIV